MNKLSRWKIYVVITTVAIFGSLSYLLQKPFVGPSFNVYQSQWGKWPLEKISDELNKREKNFANLKKECEKKIVFFNEKKQTDLVFTYIPGFSATRKEIFPVIESLSKRFSANSFLTRFPGHGQDADDYKNMQPEGFFDTTYEALEIANKLGKKKVFIGTSTGAALISSALVQGLDIDAAVLIAPAFKVYPQNSWLLSTRLGPIFNFLLVDEYRSWTPKNPAMLNYWNTRYHRDGPRALLQTLEYIRALDFSAINKPVLVLYTKNDNVVINEAIFQKFTEISHPHKRLVEIPSSSHVLAGEYTSPETTELVIKEIYEWLRSLGF